MKRFNYWGLSVILLSLLAIAAGGSSKVVATTVKAKATSTPSQEVKPLSLLTGNSTQLAQSPTNNLCRRVTSRQGLAVREKPDPNSPQTGGVDYNSEVTLASGAEEVVGTDGRMWIQLATPVSGYVSNGQPKSPGNLELCAGTVSATPPNSTPPNSTPQNSTPQNSTPENSTPPTSAPQNSTPQNSTSTQTPEIPDGQFCRQVNDLATPQGLAIRAQPYGSSKYVGGIQSNGRVQLVENYEYIPDKDAPDRFWVEIVAPMHGFVSVHSLIRCL